MPLARINIAQSASAATVRILGEAVYEAMVRGANVPANDRITLTKNRADDELVYPAEGYLGITYTPAIVFIQVTWNAGRSTEVKKAFYKAVAEGIAAQAGLRIQDIWISLIDVAREDWSFGNGEMQYAPQPA